jgi:hypothetical protein
MEVVTTAHELGARSMALMTATDISRAPERALAAVATSRNRFVRGTAVELARRYRTLFETKVNREELAHFFSQTIFVASDDWRLFELVILFRLMRALAAVSLRFTVGALTPRRSGTFARFQFDGYDVTIRYQRRPRDTATYGLAARAARHYGLPFEGPGIPDIVIERTGHVHRRVFVEAKYSADPHYLSEGLYQLVDYLRAWPAPDSLAILVGDWSLFARPKPPGPVLCSESDAVVAAVLGCLEL